MVVAIMINAVSLEIAICDVNVIMIRFRLCIPVLYADRFHVFFIVYKRNTKEITLNLMK